MDEVNSLKAQLSRVNQVTKSLSKQVQMNEKKFALDKIQLKG